MKERKTDKNGVSERETDKTERETQIKAERWSAKNQETEINTARRRKRKIYKSRERVRKKQRKIHMKTMRGGSERDIERMGLILVNKL